MNNLTTQCGERLFYAGFFVAVMMWLVLPSLAAAQTVETFTTPGASTWTAPANVYEVIVECWGAGGSGAGDGTGDGLGPAGGGGGGYARSVVSVTPGLTYSYSVGAGGAGASNNNGVAGGSSLFNSTVCVATGGGGGTGSTGGAGTPGAGGAGTGNVAAYSGGSGSAGSGASGGGGGSSAGTAAAGNSASGSTGGSAPTGGGAGANGQADGVNGAAGTAPGGGGSASGNRAGGAETGGAGAAGQVRLTYTAVTNVTYAGTVFVDAGLSTTSETFTVRMAVGTSTPPTIHTTTTTNGDYSFVFPLGGSGLTATTTMVVWVDGATTKANVAFAPGSFLTSYDDLDLWSNHVLVRHAGAAASITIADLTTYDANNDADILYTATTSITATSSVDLLSILGTSTSLYIWSGSTLSAESHLTLESGVLKVASGTLAIYGDFINSGTIVTATTSTVNLYGDFTQNGTYEANEGAVSLIGLRQAMVGNFTGSNKMHNLAIGTDSVVDVYDELDVHHLTINGTGNNRDVLNRITSPFVGNTGHGTAFSPDGTYLSVSYNIDPRHNIYKRSGDTFTLLSSPFDVAPPGSQAGNSTAFSPDGLYFSVAHNVSPFVSIYKRSGDTFTKLADPDVFPTGNGRSSVFSPDGQYLSVAHEVSPFVTIYKRSGDTFTKLANPTDLPTGTGLGTAFSPDGQYLSVAHVSSPFITIYKRSGDTFTKLANPTDLPTGLGYSTAFSPDGQYLSVAHSLSPFVTVYKRSGDTFTKIANPDVLPAFTGRSVAFSPDGQYLSVGNTNYPYITTYKRDGDRLTKIEDPNIVPTAAVYGLDYSPDGRYLSSVHLSGGRVSIYKRPENSVLQSVANINIYGNFTNLGGVYTNTATTSFVGTSTQLIINSSSSAMASNVSMSSSGAKTFIGTTSVNSLIINPDSGTTTVATTTLTILENFHNGSGSFINSSVIRFAGTRAATVSGNLVANSSLGNLVIEGPKNINFIDNASTTDISLTRTDTFTKQTNPEATTYGGGTQIAFSPDGQYVGVAHSNGYNITFYKRSGDTFTALPIPAVWPTGTGYAIAFSYDGQYVSVAHNVSPFVTIYKRDGDTFTKLADPDVLPTGTGRATAFSSDGQYLSVAHNVSPFVTIYKRSGDTFTKLANPDVLPTDSGYSTAFSPDGQYLSVGHYLSPHITIYKRDGDTFTKLTAPSVPGLGYGTAFSPDSIYLSVGHDNSPFVTIFKRSGDTFTKLANPSNLPTSHARGTAFSPDGQYLSVRHGEVPYMTLYKRSGDTFTRVLLPGIFPLNFPDGGVHSAFSFDSEYLGLTDGGGTHFIIYKRDAGATVTVSSVLDISGDVTSVDGSFTDGDGTVLLTGTNQTLTSLWATTTIPTLTKEVAATDTLNFTASSSFAFSRNLNLRGAAGNLLEVRSTATGTPFYLKPDLAASVRYVGIRDAVVARPCGVKAANSIDRGGNANWQFGESLDGMTIKINTALGSGRTVTLPLRGDVDVVIDWGDGASTTVTNANQTENVEHTYSEDFDCVVMITGSLEQFGSGATPYPNAEKITAVASFDDLGLTSLSGAFNGASNLTQVPLSLPSTVTDTSFAFQGASEFNGNISGWDMSNVTRTDSMFKDAFVFNQNIGDWNTGAVTRMDYMFASTPVPATSTSQIGPAVVSGTQHVGSFGNHFFATADVRFGTSTIHASTSGSVTFVLRKFNPGTQAPSAGTLVDSVTISGLVAGEQEIYLGLETAGPGNYWLGRTDTFSMVRQTDYASYPVSLPGITMMSGLGVDGTAVPLGWYYLFDLHVEEVPTVQMPEGTLGPVAVSGTQHVGSFGNHFIATADVRFGSATINANTSGSVTFVLRKFNPASQTPAQGTLVDSVTISGLVAGEQEIYLGLETAGPGNYWLGRTDTFSMVRQTDYASYPVSLPGITMMSGMGVDRTIVALGWYYLFNLQVEPLGQRTSSLFNQDIGGWNTAQVTNMDGMFSSAQNFNQDLSTWCVSGIASEPTDFDLDTISWGGGTTTRPQWGATCGAGGEFILSDHSQGQVANQFTATNKTDASIFGFRLTPGAGAATTTDIVLTLSGVQGVSTEQLSEWRLYRDVNADGQLDGGDVLIDGAGIMTLNGEHGAVTFSADHSVSAATNYIVVTNLSGIGFNSLVTVSLPASGITVNNATATGTASSVQHLRPRIGMIASGGSAPAGRSVVSGGNNTGGEPVEDSTSGDNITPNVNYRRPTVTGTPDNEWTNGANALISNNTYATAASTLRQSFSSFGLVIPNGNEIAGIAIRVDASGTSAAGTLDIALSWDGGASYTTAKATPVLGTNDIVYSVGGPADLWGRVWGSSDFNDQNFRLRITAAPSENTLRLDGVEVRVYSATTNPGGGGGGGGAID